MAYCSSDCLDLHLADHKVACDDAVRTGCMVTKITYRVDVPTMGQYQFWDTVVCSLLKHMREKVAHVI